MTSFSLYLSDLQYSPAKADDSRFNTSFPHETTISCLEDLQRAVKYDHMAAHFDSGAAVGAAFIAADVLMADIDSDKLPAESHWTREKVEALFAEYEYWLVEGKSHMISKDGHPPAPSYHFYFPIQKVETEWIYRDLLSKFYQKYKSLNGIPILDQACKNANRKFFATPNKVYYHPGQADRRRSHSFPAFG